ncbi:MAG: ribosome-associated translation inhibitor RaiA [Pseudomonadota bacterium]
MHVTVSGKHIDVGNALSTHVEDRLSDAVGKYFDRPVDSAVVFSRDGAGFKCDATVHLSTGLTAKAQGANHEIYAAFDQSVERIEKQLRRYKRRLKDHHQARDSKVEAFAAPAYVIAAQNDEDPAEPEENGTQPVIIAEMQTDIQSLSVGEAVMQMELAHAPFLVFKNDANGRINIVFQREDNNIGWIDPANLPDR